MVALDIKKYSKYTIDLEDSDRGCRIMSYKRKNPIEITITIEPNQRTNYDRWIVRLTNDEGKQKKLAVARLIMQHFKPEEWDEKLQVDHIDVDSLNNRLDNLQMVTHQENCQKKSSEPRRDNKSGHKNIHYNAKKKVWMFQKKLNTLYYYKYFKLLNDAIEFKKMFLIIHNCK